MSAPKWIRDLYKIENQHITVATKDLARILAQAYVALSDAIIKDQLTLFEKSVALGKLKHIEAALEEINVAVAQFTAALVQKSYGMGTDWIDENLKNTGWKGKPPPMTNIMKKQVGLLAQETYSDIAGRTNKMKEGAVRHLRTTFAEAARTGEAQGQTKDKIIRNLVRSLNAGKVRNAVGEVIPFEFVDRSGRRWDTRKYAEMAVNTYHANIARQAKTDRLVQRGFSVGQITFSGARDACSRWEGKRVALTEEASAVLELPMVSSLPNREIFHPNCRHSIGITAEIIKERRAESVARKKKEEPPKVIKKEGEEQLLDYGEDGKWPE